MINKTSILCKHFLPSRKQTRKVHNYNEQKGHTVLAIQLTWNIWYVDVRCGVCNISFCTIHSCTFYYYVKITGNIELENRKKYVSSNNDCGNTSFLYCFVHLQKWYKYLSDYIIWDLFIRYNRCHRQNGHNFCFENPISKVGRKIFRILMNIFCKHDIIFVTCRHCMLNLLSYWQNQVVYFFSETKVKTLCLPSVKIYNCEF